MCVCVCTIIAYRSCLILLHNPDPVTLFSVFISPFNISFPCGMLSLLTHHPQQQLTLFSTIPDPVLFPLLFFLTRISFLQS